MTAEASVQSEGDRNLDTVMKRVGSASHRFDVQEIRFVDCRYSFKAPSDNDESGREIEFQFRVSTPTITQHDRGLNVFLRIDFAAPSPFKEDDDSREVKIVADLELTYRLKKGQEMPKSQEADAFARVNGIFNSWPFVREYIHSCLTRLGLPPFDLPLLQAPAAAHLAGLVDLPSVEQSGLSDSD